MKTLDPSRPIVFGHESASNKPKIRWHSRPKRTRTKMTKPNVCLELIMIVIMLSGPIDPKRPVVPERGVAAAAVPAAVVSVASTSRM